MSKFESSGCRTHYHADRKTVLGLKIETPGPGNYRLPSDFGYYENKKKFGSVRGSPSRNAMTPSASQPILSGNKHEL
jgi:hypothetical protein